MRLLNTKSRSFKVLNWVAFYAMTMHMIVPGVQAMNNFSSEELVYNPNYRSSEPLAVENVKTKAPVAVKSINKVMKSAGKGGGSEAGGFSITSTDGMVDKFTGDFSYSIPLGDVEGYPLVLKYNSNVGMQTDASWVGLGWTLNAGGVDREMRGLPDEFNGDQTVVRTMNRVEEVTNGAKAGGYYGLGYDIKKVKWLSLGGQVTALLGGYNNTYVGTGGTFDFSLQASTRAQITDKIKLSLNPQFGIGYDSKRGIGTNKSIGLSAMKSGAYFSGLSLTFGNSFNSRAGMQQMFFGYTLDVGRDVHRLGASTSIMYGTQSVVPTLVTTSKGRSFSASGEFYKKKIKGPNTYSIWGLKAVYYNNSNELELNSNKQIEQKAIGYFHNGKRNKFDNDGYVLMDFNRSNDFEFSNEMKNLPVSFQTFDVFSVNAMGISGMFRGRRQDVGTYYNNRVVSENNGGGIDVGFGIAKPVVVPAPYKDFIIELGVPSNEGAQITEKDALDGGANVLSFNDEQKASEYDNAVYFKAVGEMTPENLNAQSLLGGEGVRRLKYVTDSNKKDIKLVSTLVDNLGNETSVNNGDVNQSVTRYMATDFRPYTVSEYTAISTYNQSYKNYSVFGPTMESSALSINRTGGGTANQKGAANHITAIETVSTDGTKSVFGIPVYSLQSSQVSFCAVGLSETNGLTTYSAGDDTKNNTRGISHAFDRTDMPAYASSFLLTQILSSDYVDRGNDGPTMDDVGSYYKFNYTQKYAAYDWKLPMGTNKAMFARGNLGTTEDDMAHYSCGQKEIWYMHSIESKNLIAEFVLGTRDDGHGVTADGTLNTAMRLNKLDKIVIYNRSERLGANGANAIPLQTIEFEYTYELCKNDPSNKNTGVNYAQSGKLTLSKIRTYGGASREMGVYTYEFTYDALNNVDFSYQNTDMWGKYKVNDVNKPNDLFPYGTQNGTSADNAVKAWKLIRIQNPTHGLITIDYESDTYATVQNSRAMEHLNVYKMTNLLEFLKINSAASWDGVSNAYTDFSRSFNSESDVQTVLSGWSNGDFGDFKDKFMNRLYGKTCDSYRCDYGAIDSKYFPNNVVIFALETPLSTTTYTTKAAADAYVKDKYFTNDKAGTKETVKDVYFKMLVNAKPGIQEMVPVFGRIMEDQTDVFANELPIADDFKSIGVLPVLNASGTYAYGYVVLEPSQVDEKEKKGEDASSPDVAKNNQKAAQMNSLQKAALEYIRRNLPDKLYGSCPSCDANSDLDFAMLFGGDINVAMCKRGWAANFVPASSTIRTFVSDDVKYGGNSRVKSITYTDNWNLISNEYTSNYKWNYTYKDGNAAFEPAQGIDENALYYWSSYSNIVKKYPDETKFTPTPLMVDLFPAPVVGYGAVEVRFESSVDRGKSVSEFYTSKEKPFVETPGVLDVVHTDKPTNFLTGTTTDIYAMSQGYVLKSNDYHGKQKQNSIYDANNIKIARTTYYYRDLINQVPMLNRSGILNPEYVAQESDIHIDSRVSTSEYNHFDLGLSLSIRFVFITTPTPGYVFAYVLPMPMFSHSKNTVKYKATTLIKHINQSAIVDRVETETFNSINSAENLVYDKHTGNVLLTSLKDEYDDKLFSMSYPSHWYYKELRETAGRLNTVVTSTVAADGSLTTTLIDEKLTQGDKVQLINVVGQPTLWVAKKYPWPVTGGLYLMNTNGTASTLYTGSQQLKIVKSNRKNRLGETMQYVTTKKNPLTYTNGVISGFTFPSTEIIESGALTYRDRNNYKCVVERPEKGEVVVGGSTNPYLQGNRGDLVLESQFSWQSDRVNATHVYKTRFDGTYTSYVPLYGWNGGKWYKINENLHPNYNASDLYQKWRTSGDITTYNVFGAPLESRDVLKVYSSVLYGYSNNYELVPIAEAVNARQQEIAYDGFEDYSYYSNLLQVVSESHFDFKAALNANVQLDNTQRHSGMRSLKLSPSTVATVTKKVGTGCIAADQSDVGNGVTVNACNCIKPFEPTPGDYLIGAWVKTDDPLATSNGRIYITIIGGTSAGTTTFTPTGPVIDGWQRMEATFTIPADATGITVGLQNVSGSTAVNFDDLRIHPLLAGMTTVVYDPATLLPMASHDGYNFTTFYNYDENLAPVRVRVETTEGIKTVSETEFGGYKSPKN